MVEKGYDPNSFGLIFRGATKPDDNYIPVEIESGLIKFVYNPLKFSPTTATVNPYHKAIPDFKIFIRNISVRGIITNGESSTIDTRLVPIKAGPNLYGQSPYAYAQTLQSIPNVPDGGLPNLEPWRLDYIPDMNPVAAIDISLLKNIDLTSSSGITVSAAGGGSISVPMSFLLDENRITKDQNLIRVEKVSHYANGFRYKLSFAGQEVYDDYTEQPRQMAVLSNQQTHLLNEYETEKQLREISAFQIIPEIIMDVFSGNVAGISELITDTFKGIFSLTVGNLSSSMLESIWTIFEVMFPGENPERPEETAKVEFTDEMADTFMKAFVVFGAITNPKSIMDMFYEYFLYEAKIMDRSRNSTNVGGNVVEDMLNKEVNQLLTISYPVANSVQTKTETIYPKDFAENEPHTYAINKVYTNYEEFVREISELYPGELLFFDGEPVMTYGNYTSELQKLINKGLLLL